MGSSSECVEWDSHKASMISRLRQGEQVALSWCFFFFFFRFNHFSAYTMSFLKLFETIPNESENAIC